MKNLVLFWQGALKGKLHMFKQRYLNGIPTVSDTYGTDTGEIRDDKSRNASGSRVAREWLKVAAVFLLIFSLGVGNAWGADSGLTAGYGQFILDFYDSSKLSSTSGTGLSNSNYSSFVKVYSGLTKTNVVTGVSVTGTVRYGMNGGLTAGTGTAANANTHYVSFSIGSNFPVRKATVYATAYEAGRWKLNDATASSGSLGSKGATFANVSSPLVWNLSTYATALTFKKDNGSNGNQIRLTIYTIVCEYGYRAYLTAPGTGSISAAPTTTNENGAGWNSTEGAVVGLKSTQEVTLSATPPSGKVVDAWTVKKKSDNSDVTASVLSGTTLTMPAYDVVVSVTWKDDAPSGYTVLSMSMPQSKHNSLIPNYLHLPKSKFFTMSMFICLFRRYNRFPKCSGVCLGAKPITPKLSNNH